MEFIIYIGKSVPYMRHESSTSSSFSILILTILAFVFKETHTINSNVSDLLAFTYHHLDLPDHEKFKPSNQGHEIKHRVIISIALKLFYS